jgi:hypothetical protein
VKKFRLADRIEVRIRLAECDAPAKFASLLRRNLFSAGRAGFRIERQASGYVAALEEAFNGVHAILVKIQEQMTDGLNVLFISAPSAGNQGVNGVVNFKTIPGS